MDRKLALKRCILKGMECFTDAEHRKAKSYFDLGTKIEAKAHYPHAALAAYYIKFRKYEKAIEHFKKAISLGRRDYKIYYELAQAYFWSFQFKEAKKALREANSLKIAKRQTLRSALEEGTQRSLGLDQLLEGVEVFEKHGFHLLKIDKSSLKKEISFTSRYPYLFAKVLSTLGVSAHRRGKLNFACSLSLLSLKIMPLLDAYNTLALIHADLYQFDKAKEYIEKAICLSNDTITNLNRSHIYLKCREFQRGWELFEHRKNRGDYRSYTGKLDKSKEWHGEDIQGKTLLIATEQGYGDCIQFARYFHTHLKDLGCQIIFSCREALKELMQYNFPDIKVMGLDVISKTMIDHDHYLMQGSFANLCRASDRDQIPTSYLKVPKEPYDVMQKHITPSSNLKVGIAWEVSDVQPESYNYKKIPLAYFSDLFKIDGIDFYSIQPGLEEKKLKAFPQVKRLGKHLKSFSETAAALNHMDLFISPDTGTHHAAGALGCPNWLVLPVQKCWRWFDYKTQNPWYASGRLFHQKKAGSWDTPFKEIASRLKKVAKYHQVKKYKKRDQEIYF